MNFPHWHCQSTPGPPPHKHKYTHTSHCKQHQHVHVCPVIETKQSKAKQLCLKTTPHFPKRKEELPQAGFKPATFCIPGRRSINWATEPAHMYMHKYMCTELKLFKECRISHAETHTCSFHLTPCFLRNILSVIPFPSNPLTIAILVHLMYNWWATMHFIIPCAFLIPSSSPSIPPQNLIVELYRHNH